MVHTPLRNGKIMITERKCTNKKCLALLVVVVLMWVAIDCYAVLTGDLYKLYGPVDGQGMFCGISEGYEDYKFLYYSQLSFDQER